MLWHGGAVKPIGEKAMTPTAAWMTTSRTLVAETRARLGETRTRIALNHRRLNPWWGISGSSDGETEGEAVLQSVLASLQQGFLMPVPSRVWAGKGTGQTCAVCKQTIHHDEIENEMDINGGGVTVKLWAHCGCLAVWRRASEMCTARHPSSRIG